MSGIPTLHKGIQFRARAEAKWAAFFDEIGWSWEYEPLDLPGYIPDFLVQGKLLVEVKGGACNEKDLLMGLGDLPERFSPLASRGPELYGPWPDLGDIDRPLKTIKDLRLAMATCGYSRWLPGPAGDLCEKGPLLALGAFPIQTSEDVTAHGLLIGYGADMAGDLYCDARFIKCQCGIGVTSHSGLWRCNICGASTRGVKSLDISKQWAKACNATQWKKPV